VYVGAKRCEVSDETRAVIPRAQFKAEIIPIEKIG
jgi:hypothetical protein